MVAHGIIADLGHAGLVIATFMAGAILLAGLLVLTAWNMSEPHKWRGCLRSRSSDRFLLILTLVLTVVADLTIAIGTGVAIGLALRLSRRGAPPAEWETPDR